MKKELFANNTIQNEERGFLEELLEALDLVADVNDVGNTIEYSDEDGCTLFCVDIISDNSYLFRFYENSYPVSEEVLSKVCDILGVSRDGAMLSKSAETVNA